MNESSREPGSPFDRLPERVKQEALEKERKHQERIAEAERKLRELSGKTSIVGGVVAVMLALLTGSHPTLVVLLGAVGAITAYIIAERQLGHLAGIGFYGGMGCVLSRIGCYLGMSHEAPWIFFGWIFYLVAGALIAIWVKGRRAFISGM